MGKFDPELTCVVCGCNLPYFPKDVCLQKGMATNVGSSQTVHHCPVPKHTYQQIQDAIFQVPVFKRASELK